MIKFSKICLHKNWIFENFENPLNFFYKIREILFVNKENPHVFYFEEKMFTNESKYGKPRKKSSKRPGFLVS